MKGRDFLQRTPVRLAATFSILFTATFLVFFAVLYSGISARLAGEMQHRAQEAISAISAFDDPRSMEELIEIIKTEASSIRDSDFIFSLVDENGAFVAGNVRTAPNFAGSKYLKRSELSFIGENGDPQDSFLATWQPLSKGRLLVGVDDGELRQMQSYLLTVLGYGVLVTAVVISLVSLYLARKTQHRIQVFSRTLAAVSRGQITARVPMSGSADDIDQVATQVNKTLGRLQTLIENVNQSSSDIAHDLKKPISRIRQRLDETSRTASHADEFRIAIDAVIEDLDSITETFEALLRITQIEAGASKLRFKHVDLQRLLNDVWEVYAAVAEDAGQRLEPAQNIEGKADVWGDEALLLQLFANLVENSICHSPKGTAITLFLRRQNDGLRVSVCDNGPGIPESEYKNVFRRLYRLERARSTTGSGLGLSLAAAIAELHDARIALSDNQPGLCVTVHFPPSPSS